MGVICREEAKGVGVLQNRLRVLEKELLAETDRVFIVGDLHGDLATLERVLETWDSERDLLVLLGDYGDRGKKGIEVIQRVNQLLDEHPLRVVALQGNHEDFSADGEPYFSPCDLIDEAQGKLGSWSQFWRDTFQPFIGRLHLAAVIPGETLFVHGGVSSRIHHLSVLASPTGAVELDVLYSDPTTAFLGQANNNIRQCGVLFGSDVSEVICERLGVQRMVRGHSHAIARFQPDVVHGGRVTTIISSSVFATHPYVVVFPADAPQEMKRMSVEDGKVTDILVSEEVCAGTNDGVPVLRAIQLDREVKLAYDSLPNYCRSGNLPARFRLPSAEHLDLAVEEGCDFFSLPIHEIVGEVGKVGDQRSLIVEMHRQTQSIVGVFYAPQMTATALRRVES